MNIQENYHRVREKIAIAAHKANRPLEDIHLLAVSKFHTPDALALVAKEGQIDFAESYIQEAKQKKQDLSTLLPENMYKSLQWHSIGHIQTNKVKDILNTYTLIHAVDSIRLAQALNKALAQKLLKQNILLEINMGEEEQKHGFLPSEAVAGVEAILQLASLQIQGFMCLPPYSLTLGENRKYFRGLYDLKASVESKFRISMPVLSMGTSSDYSDAILEGATHVRVGTEIFGERKK